jgi:tetratricopeptide (TPR) repeat protein/predicted Ser/Thr protein kinase/TolB-like protein
MIGETIDRYQVVEKLGEGGMGVVYRARDTLLGRFVALKALPSLVADDPARRRRFIDEAKAASTLQHPGIVAIHDVVQAGGRDYIVMEYVAGQTLEQRMGDRALPLGRGLRYAEQIADAVACAHAAGIVHRDLKPGNVMLTGDDAAKILDFGLAKLVEAPFPGDEARTLTETKGPEALSRAGAVVGTIAYMSPEQAEGGPVDARTDIFSFGVLLYRMLTGQHPFRRGSSAETLSAIREADPVPPGRLAPQLPPEAERAILRCLHKDPSHRWQSMSDLKAVLQDLREDSDTGTRTGPAPPRRPGAALRGLGASWRFALVAGVVLAAAALLVRAPWRARAPTTTMLDPRRAVVAVFENRTGDPRLDPLGRIAADWISEGLAHIESLQVVPGAIALETSRETPRATTAPSSDPLQGLAALTGAGLVVSGAIHLEGSELRVRARVTDAATRTLTALEPCASPRESPMLAIEAARQRVMGALAVRLDPLQQWTPVAAGDVPSYEAYQQYLAGLELVGKDDVAAVARFKRALELDPGFIAPRLPIVFRAADYEERAAQLAALEALRGRLSPVQRQTVAAARASLAGHNEEAFIAAREAARVSPPNVAGNFQLAFYAQIAGHAREAVEALSAPLDWQRVIERPGARGAFYFYNLAESLHLLGEHERELAVARRGLTIHPDLLFLRTWEGRALAALGRLAEVDRVVDDGLTMAGHHAGMMLVLGLELRAHGHPEAARDLANRALVWHRDHPPAKDHEDRREALGQTLEVAEMWDAARALYERAASERSDKLEYRAALGRLAARSGDRAAARRISDRLSRVERPHLRGRHTLLRAGIAAHMGEKDWAVELLRASLAQGVWYDIALHQDLGLEPLHGDPAYEALVKPKD